MSEPRPQLGEPDDFGPLIHAVEDLLDRVLPALPLLRFYEVADGDEFDFRPLPDEYDIVRGLGARLFEVGGPALVRHMIERKPPRAALLRRLWADFGKEGVTNE